MDCRLSRRILYNSKFHIVNLSKLMFQFQFQQNRIKKLSEISFGEKCQLIGLIESTLINISLIHHITSIPFGNITANVNHSILRYRQKPVKAVSYIPILARLRVKISHRVDLSFCKYLSFCNHFNSVKTLIYLKHIFGI